VIRSNEFTVRNNKFKTKLLIAPVPERNLTTTPNPFQIIKNILRVVTTVL